MKKFLVAVSLLSLPVLAAEPKIPKLWRTRCQSCHGVDGKAQTDKGKKMQMLDLSTAAWQASKSDDDIKKAIKAGTKLEKDGVKKEMDAYADYTEEQLTGLVAHIRSLKQ